MSAWKRLATESFPEWSAEIEPAMAVQLSSLLSRHLVEALQSADTSLVERILRYVSWVWAEGGKNEPLAHLAMDIVRESVRREPLRLQLWAALHPGMFRRLIPVASGALGRDTSAEFEREYRHTVR